ncbi:MAG: lipoyl(octanoyl) transferase LipB [Chitinophagaceae bacterium]|nr:lipoyl(octanoyl) transferase LipB [Chitinophagaceae bacterium]
MQRNKKIQVIDLGCIDYKEAWDFQEKKLKEITEQKIKNRDMDENQKERTPNYLLFCSHPNVYTLGTSGKIEHLKIPESALQEKNISFYKTNRGGDITFHGEGQIVVYPILDLDNFFTDIHKYMRTLEESVIKTLKEFNITSGRMDKFTGVWTEPENPLNSKKICAMGVKLSRWVTMHGLALNVNTHLEYFQHIIPCGITHREVTSMKQELGYELNIMEVQQRLEKNIMFFFQTE